MKSGQNGEDFQTSPVAPQALSTCKGLPQGGKIAGDLWWLTKFKGIFWAQKLVYHMFHGWNCELLKMLLSYSA